MNRIRKAVGIGSKQKGKKKAGPQMKNQDAGQTRGPNWGDEETHVLLDAAREVQLSSNRRDLCFTRQQWNQIYELFKLKDSNSRTVWQIENRIKTLKGEFSKFRELANKSGWSWNFEEHKPIAPEGAWQELLNDGTPRWQGFHKKTCPWYQKMLEMCGGKMARGDADFHAYTTENSVAGSETGSSDEPRIVHESENGPYFYWNGDGSQLEDTVQQPPPQSRCAAGTSIPDTMAGSHNSGSQKRKSTDEGPEMSKGKKIQRRISEKSKGMNAIVETGAQLIKLNEQLVSEVGRSNNIKEERNRFISDKEKEIDRCLEKLNGLKLDAATFHIIRGKFKDADERRYFLGATEDDILTWIDMIKFQQGAAMNQQGGTHPHNYGFYPQQGGMYNNAPNPYDFFNMQRPPHQ